MIKLFNLIQTINKLLSLVIKGIKLLMRIYLKANLTQGIKLRF